MIQYLLSLFRLKEPEPYVCPRCVARGGAWSGTGVPRCAFPLSIVSGLRFFVADNYDCATMSWLREIGQIRNSGIETVIASNIWIFEERPLSYSGLEGWRLSELEVEIVNKKFIEFKKTRNEERQRDEYLAMREKS